MRPNFLSVHPQQCSRLLATPWASTAGESEALGGRGGGGLTGNEPLVTSYSNTLFSGENMEEANGSPWGESGKRAGMIWQHYGIVQAFFSSHLPLYQSGSTYMFN